MHIVSEAFLKNTIYGFLYGSGILYQVKFEDCCGYKYCRFVEIEIEKDHQNIYLNKIFFGNLLGILA